MLSAASTCIVVQAVQCCIPFSHSLINKSKSMKLLLLLFLYLISYSFFTEANSCLDDIPEYQDEDANLEKSSKVVFGGMVLERDNVL